MAWLIVLLGKDVFFFILKYSQDERSQGLIQPWNECSWNHSFCRYYTVRVLYFRYSNIVRNPILGYRITNEIDWWINEFFFRYQHHTSTGLNYFFQSTAVQIRYILAHDHRFLADFYGHLFLVVTCSVDALL